MSHFFDKDTIVGRTIEDMAKEFGDKKISKSQLKELLHCIADDAIELH